MFRYITAILFSLFSFTAFSQKAAIVPGQIIIMLQKEASYDQFVSEFNDKNRSSDISYFRKLSKSQSIYVIQSDVFEGSERTYVSQIKKMSSILTAQVNHVVAQRANEPNDPRYSEQWQWKNNGDDDGKPGADINAEAAWDITTGGLTSAGDTIVVCIVDDGTNYDHEDLSSNIWFNKSEIAGNGIDDDNNGYIDDVHGWNFDDDNDNVNDGGHGVNVNGMIGAVGNNNIGVSGINWNVKMMNVVYAGVSEDAVIESYDYPLQSRILYNTTNGAQGAFVVSVNSSWGIDFGDPEDAPLWCNFYDIMGAAGIINVAATSNSEINVDEEGDLPTGCSSPYLISVGRTDKRDEYAACGYGTTTIDLGAPGVNIVTTRSNNRYTTTTGTSFSSPLVAGMVALLYSYPCPQIGTLMHQDYPSFALLVKNAILQGVDVMPEYADKCLTGGRANMLKSLEVVSLACAACQPGVVESFTYKEDNTYILTFDDSQLQTNLRYRASGTTDWTEILDVTNPYELVLPLTCTAFDFQLQNICEPNDTSLWGLTKVFSTGRCCESLEEMSVVHNIDGEITIYNANLNQDINTVIFYKKESDQNYTELELIADTITISGLDDCTFYNVYASAICINGDVIVSPTQRIFTNCPSNCSAVNCLPTADAVSGHIDNIIFNGVTAQTGNNSGFLDYGNALNLQAPDFGSFSAEINVLKEQGKNGRIRVFVDKNNDGQFGASENIFTQLIGVNNTKVNFDYDFDGAITEGSFKMRVMLTFLASEQPCNGDEGEAEDYCLNIYHVLQNECEQVDTIYQTNKTFTSIDLNWDKPQDDVIAYAYRYRELPDGDYTYLSDTAHKALLKNLKECTDYEFGIITVCQSDTSSFKVLNFRTDCTSSSNDLDDEITWKVYPNPFADRINVMLTSRSTGEGRLRLTDAKGTIVVEQKLNLTAGDHYFNLDANANIAPGMYILTLTDGKKVKSTKLVKQ